MWSPRTPCTCQSASSSPRPSADPVDRLCVACRLDDPARAGTPGGHRRSPLVDHRGAAKASWRSSFRHTSVADEARSVPATIRPQSDRGDCAPTRRATSRAAPGLRMMLTPGMSIPPRTAFDSHDVEARVKYHLPLAHLDGDAARSLRNERQESLPGPKSTARQAVRHATLEGNHMRPTSTGDRVLQGARRLQAPPDPMEASAPRARAEHLGGYMLIDVEELLDEAIASRRPEALWRSHGTHRGPSGPGGGPPARRGGSCTCGRCAGSSRPGRCRARIENRRKGIEHDVCADWIVQVLQLLAVVLSRRRQAKISSLCRSGGMTMDVQLPAAFLRSRIGVAGRSSGRSADRSSRSAGSVPGWRRWPLPGWPIPP